MKKNVYILMAICLFGALSEATADQRQENIELLDEEISSLTQIAESYRSLENSRERYAQKFMQRDWATYAREMEIREYYDNMAERTEAQIQQLKKSKQKLIEEHAPTTPTTPTK